MQRVERRRQWVGRIEEWKSSGLTQRAYCERESILYATFKRWGQRLGLDRGRRGAAPRLVPVRVAPVKAARRMLAEPIAMFDRASAGRCAQIRLGNGRAIALGRELDEVELGRLIRLLEVLPC